MLKTITLRLDEDIYAVFKRAAQGKKRTISNFIEYAAINYLTTDAYVSDDEMQEILADKELVHNLKKGLSDIDKGRYKFARSI